MLKVDDVAPGVMLKIIHSGWCWTLWPSGNAPPDDTFSDERRFTLTDDDVLIVLALRATGFMTWVMVFSTGRNRTGWLIFSPVEENAHSIAPGMMACGQR